MALHNKTTAGWKGSNNTIDTTTPRRGSRRSWRSIGLSAAVLVIGMLQQPEGVKADFEVGEPINVVVTPSDSLTLSFSGSSTDAVAISYQQCSGSQYMRMDVRFNGTSVRSTTYVEDNQCTRIIGGGASLDNSGLNYDNLCTFKSSGTVGLGYTEESETLNGTISSSSVDPDLVTVVLYNGGDTTASAQLVMFSDSYPAPNADAAIDRVYTKVANDANTVTIESVFQASGSADQTFCTADNGCAVYAYYIIVDEDGDEDMIFSTSCQARTGVMVYEGSTNEDSVVGNDSNDDTDADTAAVAQAVTTFDMSACIQLPKNTAATYIVYIVVSPDVSTYARIGYGLQDQLVYASDPISIEEGMDVTCPEEEEVVVEETSAAPRTVVIPIEATGMMAVGLASAAAARAGF